MTTAPTDTITILRSDKPLAKEVVLGNDGLPVIGRAKMGFLFDVAERSVAGLHDIHARLQDLQHDQYATAIRGRLIEGRPTEAVRRISRDQNESPRNFDPCPRQWLMVDVDDLPLTTELADVNAHACGSFAGIASRVPRCSLRFPVVEQHGLQAGPYQGASVVLAGQGDLRQRGQGLAAGSSGRPRPM